MEISHSRLRGTGSDFQLISSVTASEASIWNQGKVKWRRCHLLPPHHSAAQLHNEKQRAFLFFQTQLDGLALVFLWITLPSNAFYGLRALFRSWKLLPNGQMVEQNTQVHRANVPGGSPKSLHHSLFNYIPNISIIALMFCVGFIHWLPAALNRRPELNRELQHL